MNVSDILTEYRGWTKYPACFFGKDSSCLFVPLCPRGIPREALGESAQTCNLFTQDQSVDIVRTLVGLY